MCDWGKYEIVYLAFPNEICGRTEVPVDQCIAPLVQMLNDHGFHTVGSCCGHGKIPTSIILESNGQRFEITAERKLFRRRTPLKKFTIHSHIVGW